MVYYTEKGRANCYNLTAITSILEQAEVSDYDASSALFDTLMAEDKPAQRQPLKRTAKVSICFGNFSNFECLILFGLFIYLFFVLSSYNGFIYFSFPERMTFAGATEGPQRGRQSRAAEKTRSPNVAWWRQGQSQRGSHKLNAKEPAENGRKANHCAAVRGGEGVGRVDERKQ